MAGPFQLVSGILSLTLLVVQISGSSIRQRDPPVENVGNIIHRVKTKLINGMQRSDSNAKIRPIIFMHGIFGEGNEVDFAKEYIPKRVPGTVIYYINMFKGFKSAMNLNLQLDYILPAMQKIMNNHTDTGVTLLCYSQGGVICRSAVQMLSAHNVHTMITLSCPLNGQYGVTSSVQRFAKSVDRKDLWKFWYTGMGQWISIGAYWNDPHRQEEFSNPKTNVLLARLNNQTGHANSTAYKNNFLKLHRLVMIGGPDDKVITPWQSAHLGFYNSNETVLSFEKHSWYSADHFGMRTLSEAGKVIRHTHPGVHHTEWYKNQHVFDNFVVPYI